MYMFRESCLYCAYFIVPAVSYELYRVLCTNMVLVCQRREWDRDNYCSIAAPGGAVSSKQRPASVLLFSLSISNSFLSAGRWWAAGAPGPTTKPRQKPSAIYHLQTRARGRQTRVDENCINLRHAGGEKLAFWRSHNTLAPAKVRKRNFFDRVHTHELKIEFALITKVTNLLVESVYTWLI